MTKVQTRFKLQRALSERELESLAHVHAVYGILAARLQLPEEEVFIEYDASRLSLPEVRAMLEQHGLPVQ
jgi:hypothetical protein